MAGEQREALGVIERTAKKRRDGVACEQPGG
jgi:hypothetical protein